MIQPDEKFSPNHHHLIASDETTKSKNAVKNADQIDAKVSSKAPHELTVFVTGPNKGGKGGELQITNAKFVANIFPKVPEAAFAAVCTKDGDPNLGGLTAHLADDFVKEMADSANNFVGCSSFYPSDDGSFSARKINFAACHFLMLDDLGTKVPLERLAGFELSWLIETSPGNYQGGIVFAEPLLDGNAAIRLLNAVIDEDLCDKGANSPVTRWARLPVSINGKTKYLTPEGAPFQCRLVEWRPDKRYALQEIVEGLQLKLAPAGKPKKSNKFSIQGIDESKVLGPDEDEVLTPKAAENPVVAALKAKGLYKTPLGSGKHDVTCPWFGEHTDALDTGAAYFEPDESYPIGGFCCQHSHRYKYRIGELLVTLGVRTTAAKNKPVIRIVPGEMDRVVDVAEKELANRGRHYQSGGLIVSVSTDPTSGDPSVIATSAHALTRELSVAATWEKYDSRKNDWARTDPPTRHAAILFDSQKFKHLPPLAGVVRQPYFRSADGVLVTQPGYDAKSHLFGVFDPRTFPLPKPTQEAAMAALKLLEDLIPEFHFLNQTDKAAALSAMFTAVVRQTLPFAPAYHVRAPVFGSGKTYLCELIGAFAGPGGNSKVSYPTTSEEATKVILSLLMTSPAVIEFDDMDTDWIPHGTIKRMLTAEHITDRILGVSKTASVSTRTLFLGSGNNVGPVRDLLRRVLTIHIDPRCSTPATIAYKEAPVEKVRKDRGKYVSAVITIIQAYLSYGTVPANAGTIVTFDGAWSKYCRYPLMWLGYPDPATSLLDQVRHDPDGDALFGLMTVWHKSFGSKPTTIRTVLDTAQHNHDLMDAIKEFPVEDRGGINSSKFGWLLSKNANRIVGGLEFRQGWADGRNAWCVMVVKPPPSLPIPASPPLPPLNPSSAQSVTPTVEVEI